VFPDADRTHRAFLLHVILWSLVLVPVPYTTYIAVAEPQDLRRALVQSTFGEVVNFVLLVLLRRGRVALASIAQVSCFWLFFMATAMTRAGTSSEAYEMGFPLVILLAGMLLSTRGAIVATVASLLGGLAILVAARAGIGTPERLDDQTLTWVVSLCVFPLTAVLQYLGASLIRTSLTALQAANAEIRELNAGLERKVEERTAQLSASNRELEAFSYAVSHDLRAPLRAISGFSQALAEDEAIALGPVGVDHLARIRSASVRMDELIRALLDLSRITRTELQRTDTDLSQLALSVGADLARAEPDRAVELVVEPGLHVQADPVLLRVVLTNLMGNSWKFSSKTEKPRVEIGTIRAEGSAPVFFVRDNGAGFAMTEAAQLFAAFKRLHSPRDFPGTGVGLAIVQRAVAHHGGRIWAESAPGKGATFFFTLAAEPEKKP
jgi:signal transduction histidine kinase